VKEQPQETDEKLDARHPRSILRNFFNGSDWSVNGHAQHNLRT
jgi:hypothetical protein